MKTRRFWKISTAWCLAVVLLLAAYLPAMASEEQGKTGSIQLQLPEGQEYIEMRLCPIADFVNGGFVFNKDFAGSKVEIPNLNDSEQAQKGAADLAEFVLEQGISGMTGNPNKEGVLRFENLKPALYLVLQSQGAEKCTVQAALVPIPYLGADGQTMYDAVLSLKYSFPGGAVILDKVDDDGNVVEQVTFTLQEKKYVEEDTEIPEGAEILADEDGNYFWKEFAASLETDENGQIVVTDMPMGDYRFVEVSAPQGLIVNHEPVEFSITNPGQVAVVDGIYAPSEEEEGEVQLITVVNEQTKVEVNKVDEEGNPVPGAKLVVKSADGQVLRDGDNNVLYSFTSQSTPYVLKRIPGGDYLLSEVEAPEGYKISIDVPFTVDDSENAVYEVIMVDESEDETDVELKITKVLTDEMGLDLMAEDAVFYVALFEDEEKTIRVSNVQAVHYHGTHSETVTFTNLEEGKTYYLAETDEFGEPMEGMQYGNGVFLPDYPDGYAVTPSAGQDHELTFGNMFFEIPDGFYYNGSLIVTKKVLKGSEEYNTDQVFYAAIFTDAACTQRYGDVIPLEMSGGSETSVTIDNIFIGLNAGDSATYYVAETDANGNVLDPNSRREYKVSVDKTEITLTPENSVGEVVITNTFEDTPSVTTPPTGNGSGPRSNPGESTSPIKTGDDTPVGTMIAVLAAAAIVILIAGGVIYKKKRR